METLFIYCSDDDAVNALCNESALRKRDTHAVELMCSRGKTLLSRYLGFTVKRRTYKGACDIDINDYDRVILACDECFGEIPEEIKTFILGNDLRYKDIDCIVFGDGRYVGKAKDALRVSVSLSGGTVRNAVSISAKELKREEEDVLFSIRHRLAV